MYTIDFYEDEDGHSQVEEWMKDLNQRAERDKNARIQLKQLIYVMRRVEADGTRAGSDYVDRIRDEIYELRPGDNRVLFFGWQGNHVVLLCHFRKKGKRTPQLEIEKAERLMNDWIRRKRK